MSRALFAIDMQGEYLENYPAEPVERVNARIRCAERDGVAVVYILNGKRLRSGPVVPALSPALAVVSDTFFVKACSSVLGDAVVTEWLASRRIEALELAGIDGNCCVCGPLRAGRPRFGDFRLHRRGLRRRAGHGAV